MNSSAGLIAFGLFCLYPMVFLVIGFFIGRYRLRLRMPITIERDEAAERAIRPQVVKPGLRRIQPLPPEES
jgi:hypothetical protein